MRVQWQQFSPGEKEALLKHYVFHRVDVQVSPEKVCQAMQNTHFLACVSPGNGSTLVEFISSRSGTPTGAAISNDLTDGIYQAALRAYGVDLECNPPSKPKPGPVRRDGKVHHV
jgi:hypothetical protein